jgi:hypothetical protein
LFVVRWADRWRYERGLVGDGKGRHGVTRTGRS